MFYRNQTDDGVETYAVSIGAGSDFVASIPELLFTSDHGYNTFSSQYSVAADGQRFMMLKPAGEEAVEPIAIDGIDKLSTQINENHI